MHALFVEVDAPQGVPLEVAREVINRDAVPTLTAAGAKAGYWLAPQDGRVVCLVLFDDEVAATEQASRLSVGDRPDGAPDGVAFRTADVREVLVQL